MNISKFLLIDVTLAITAIPIIYFLQGRKTSLFRSSSKEELLKNTPCKLPNKEKLLEFEKNSKVKGSGIKFDSLFGNWKFISVWKKKTDDEDYVFSSLLRSFSASLELKKNISTENQLTFLISASIQFGIFSIEFSGAGYLKGKQPLLIFFFNLIELKSGSTILLSRSIREPVEKGKSFFALIASGESGRWLSARGQGGSLVLWLKD